MLEIIKKAPGHCRGCVLIGGTLLGRNDRSFPFPAHAKHAHHAKAASKEWERSRNRRGIQKCRCAIGIVQALPGKALVECEIGVRRSDHVNGCARCGPQRCAVVCQAKGGIKMLTIQTEVTNNRAEAGID